MPFVRASAASQFTPSAGIPAARSDTSTPKTNEASPFAVLVDAAATSRPKAADKKAADQKGAGSKPDSDAGDQTATAQTATQKTSRQNTSAQPRTASAADNSQPAAQPASGKGQVSQPPADENAAPASDAAPAPAPLPIIAQPPAPPAGQMTQAANDDAAPTDDTAAGEDAVALWPQSIRPGAGQGAPQAKPGKTDAKTDKDIKKDAADADAQPDDAAALAANAPPPEQKLVTAAEAIAPPPTPAASAPSVQPQADTAVPAIQPAVQPAAPPALPQDPAEPAAAQQAIGQQPADQHLAGQQLTGQQRAGQAAPPAATPVKTPAIAPETVAPAQNKVGANQPPQAPDPVPAKDQPQPDAIAKADASKPAKATGKTPTGDDATAVKAADSTPVDAEKVHQPEAPKPAPTPDTGLKTTVAPITPGALLSAAPQAQGPAITQHVQVTAQPHEATPNLPALAVAIAGKSQSGAKQFDIRLDPPELGRVEVRLSIDATGKASAHLSADQPQTLNLLQKDAHVLTRALRDAGLDVSQDGLNFSLRQQQDNGAGAQSNQSGGRSGRSFALTATTSLEATASSAAYSGAADGHLDIRV